MLWFLHAFVFFFDHKVWCYVWKYLCWKNAESAGEILTIQSKKLDVYETHKCLYFINKTSLTILKDLKSACPNQSFYLQKTNRSPKCLFLAKKKLATVSWRTDANLPSALRLSIAALRDEFPFPLLKLTAKQDKPGKPPCSSVRGGTAPIFFPRRWAADPAARWRWKTLPGVWKRPLKKQSRSFQSRFPQVCFARSDECIANTFVNSVKGHGRDKRRRKKFQEVNGASAGFCQPFKGTFKGRCEHTKAVVSTELLFNPFVCGVGKQGWFAVYGFCRLFFFCRLPVCEARDKQALKQQWRNSSHKTNTACLKTRAVLFAFLNSDEHLLLLALWKRCLLCDVN